MKTGVNHLGTSNVVAMIHESVDIGPNTSIGHGTTIWHLTQVREGAVIGEFCNLGRAVYVGPGVVVGDNCKIQNFALIYEPARLGTGVFVGPAAVLTNDLYPRAVNLDGSPKGAKDWQSVGVVVKDGASIGARAICVAPVTIGQWAMVGAGSVVIRDIPDHALVVGNPAHQIGWVCRCGRRLAVEDRFWSCIVCSRNYLESEGGLLDSRQ